MQGFCAYATILIIFTMTFGTDAEKCQGNMAEARNHSQSQLLQSVSKGAGRAQVRVAWSRFRGLGDLQDGTLWGQIETSLNVGLVCLRVL